MSNENYNIGPCWIFTAPNVTDGFDSWANLGYTQGNVQATIQNGKYITNTVDQLGSTPYAAALYKFGDTFQFTFPLVDKQISTLLEVVPGATKLTGSSKEAFAIGAGMDFLSGAAFALVPVSQYTEGAPWWKSTNTIWMFKGYANPSSEIETFKQAAQNDLNAYSVTVTHVNDSHGRGGIGCVWRLGVDVLGFNKAASFNYAVTNANTLSALNTAGFTTVRDLVANTGSISLANGTLTDISGLEYAFNSSGIDVSSNNITQASMSAFIHEVWLQRDILGNNSATIDISGNNGVNAQATAEISDLTAAGVTITT